MRILALNWRDLDSPWAGGAEVQLQAVAEGYSWYDLDALRAGVPIFTELYRDHIALEESMIYPEARRRDLNQRAGEASRKAAK